MTDKTVKIGGSLIQHGKSSDRVYLMKLAAADFPGIIGRIDTLAEENGYTKIFAKVPQWAKKEFELAGYRTEAHIPGFFNKAEDAYFMSRYPDEKREEQRDKQESEKVLTRAKSTVPIESAQGLKDGFCCSVLASGDAKDMADVYKTVFETYPFPIFDPEYIKETMRENIVYFGIKDDGRLVALSSCEMDVSAENVEMTDFATLPKYRSNGLASFLLYEMEREMRKRDIYTAYTIARSLSYGMNITFAKNGYEYSGTLVNNTNISGSIESMNVWYKAL